MLFIRNDTPAKKISVERPVESFYVELNFRKIKWLSIFFHNLNPSSIESHLGSLSESIDSLSSKYDSFILQVDFISCMEDSLLKKFAEIYKLRNLIKEPTCFKNPENHAGTDLILTNKPRSLKNTYVIETGQSDFHKMIVAVMKMHFPKMKPEVVSYQKYKDFHNQKFSLRYELIKL